MTNTTKTGTEMAREIASYLMSLGATEEQAKNATRRGFARFAFSVQSAPESLTDTAAEMLNR